MDELSCREATWGVVDEAIRAAEQQFARSWWKPKPLAALVASAKSTIQRARTAQRARAAAGQHEAAGAAAAAQAAATQGTVWG